MPLELKNDIEEKNVSINFDRIRTQFNILEKDMLTLQDTLIRIEEKLDTAHSQSEKTSQKITVSKFEFRIYTFILFAALFGGETVLKSKAIQSLMKMLGLF